MNVMKIFFLGKGYKPKFKFSTKMPHPQMDPRNELNIHVFGYRIAITWGKQ